MNTKDAVSKLLENVRERLVTTGLASPSEALTLQTAKELNLVVGKRGRDGGCFATDSGLQLLGINVDEFRATETASRQLVKAQRAKTPKTETNTEV